MGSNAFIKHSSSSILHSFTFFVNYQQITSLKSCMFNSSDIWEGKYIQLQLLHQFNSLSYLLIFIRHLHFNLPHFPEIYIAVNTIITFCGVLIGEHSSLIYIYESKYIELKAIAFCFSKSHSQIHRIDHKINITQHDLVWKWRCSRSCTIAAAG